MAFEAEDDDLHADIRAAMEPEIPAAGADAEPAPAAAAPDPAEPVQAPEIRPDGRDEKGRFAKSGDAEQAPGSVDAAPPEPASPTIRPPPSWSAEAKSQFATLPPTIQQEVLKRETEIQQGKAQWDTKAESYNKLDAILAPLDTRLAIAGTTRENYLTGLIKADEMLRGENRSEALVQIARMYGIPLPNGQPQQYQQVDPPAQAPVTPQLVEAAVQTALQRQRQEAGQAEADAAIADFAADPANLYFENVKAEMGALLKAGSAKTLQDAYRMACNARDDIRALLTPPAQPKQQPVPTQPNALSLTGSPPLGGSQASGASGGSLEDDIRAAMQEHSARV